MLAAIDIHKAVFQAAVLNPDDGQITEARGIEARLCDPGQASALQGKRKRPKTDRLDARWLVLLLARELLPGAWLPPEDIQRLRDQTRLRKALSDDHTRWAQRLRSLLVHEGWLCSRGSLLTAKGRRWVAGVRLHPTARAQNQHDAHRHGHDLARDRPDRLWLAPPGQDRPAAASAAAALRHRTDPGLHRPRRDRRRRPIPPRPPSRPGRRP